MTDNDETTEPTMEPESGWRSPATEDAEAEGHGYKPGKGTDDPSMNPDEGWRSPATEPNDDEVEGHQKA